jgi:hypothetical protein
MKTLGESAKENRKGKRNNLREQKGQDHLGVVDAHRAAIGGRHADDGVDAVDVEEKRQHEEQHMLLAAHALEGSAQGAQRFTDDPWLARHKIRLAIGFEQGNGEQSPPQAGDDERQSGCGFRAQARGIRRQDEHDAQNERHTAGDVANAVSRGGNRVHALIGRDVREHGVVKDQRGVVAYLRDDKNSREPRPSGDDAHGDAGGQTDDQRPREQLDFHAAKIGNGAEQW